MVGDCGHARDEEVARAAEVAAELSDVVYALRLEPDMAFEYVSPSVEALVGYTPAEHYADPSLGTKLLDPRDAGVLARSGQAEVGEPVGFTVRWRSKDGRTVWTEHRCRKQRREDGSVVLYGAARDVSAEHDLAVRLAQVQEQYRLLAENSSDLVFRLDADGVIEWVSPSVTEALGWDPEQLVGLRSVDDLVASRQQARDEQSRLQAMMDSLLDPHVLLQAVRDQHGTIVDFVYAAANDAACDSMQMSSGELVGAHLLELPSGQAGSGMLSMYADALDSGEPLVLDNYAYPHETQEDERRYDIRAVRVGEDLSFTWRDVTDRHRQAEALAASEEQYRLLAEHATDMVWQLDGDGVILWMAPAPESALGWTPEQLLGTVALDLVHPDDLPGLRVWRDQIMAGTPMLPLDVRMRCVDGGYRWTSGRTEQIVDEHGEVTGRVVGLRDAHEQVLALEALRVERARLRAILDSLLDPHILVEALRDDDGRIVDLVYTDANPAACAYNDKSYQDLVGSRVLDLLPGQEGSGLMAQYRQVIESGEPLVLDDFVYAHEVLGGVQHFYDIRAVRIGDGLSYTWRQVTDRHEAAVALAAAERRYRLLAQNATDAVFLVDLIGAISWVSPAVRRVLGYQPQELEGTMAVDLAHPEDLSGLSSMAAKVAAGQEGVHWQVRLRTRDGEYRWMSAVSGPMIDADGAVNGRITTVRDVHEQVLNREALARSEEMFRLAMEGAPEGMAVLGLHLAYRQVNGALCAMLGRDEEWMLCHSIRDVLAPESLDADLVARDRLLAGEAEFDIHEARMITATGAPLWVQHSIALVRDEHRMPLFYVSQYQDITDARARKADLEYRAQHDALTGLINREQLQRRIADVLTRVPRRAGVPALLFCDLDHFKWINDQHGHAAGDHVLRVTADRISSTLRDTDEVARLGGDEFVAVLPEAFDLDAAAHIAQKVRTAVAQPIPIGGEQIVITISIGVALATPGIEARRLLHNADDALYEAKNSGRDRVATFTDH
ncbi:MAG: PAS domain S-box protein [Actinomycetes bacterium]